MKEQLVSFETAKLAKEKGFTEECLHFYCKNKVCDHIEEPYEYSFRVNGNKDSKDNLGYGITWSAPTQSLLQKWLREKHNIIVTSLPYEDEIPECEGEKRQTLWEDETIDCRETPWLREITTYTYYHSYEKALEIGLQEALRLI